MKYVEKIGYKSASRLRVKLGNINYYPYHIHDDSIEIICVLDGSVEISDSVATYTLGYGDVHIFNMNDPHRIIANGDNIILTLHFDYSHYCKSNTDSDVERYFISDAPEPVDMHKSETDLHNYSSDIKLLRFHLAKLWDAYNSHVGDITLESMGTELFNHLLDNFQNYTYIENDRSPAYIVHSQITEQNRSDFVRMNRIVDYIYDHYDEKITLQQIADMEYLSAAHLSRYLKQTLGLTFSQQLSLARCEEAARLLASSSMTVDQIAVKVGFANRKHFATQFRKWHGKNPTQYRQEIEKDLRADSVISLRPFDYEFAMKLIDMNLDEY